MSPQPQSPLTPKSTRGQGSGAVVGQTRATNRPGLFTMTEKELAKAQAKVRANDLRCWLPAEGAL